MYNELVKSSLHLNNMSKLTKYTGVDFYEHYILPTNRASKNPLWKNFWRPFWKTMQDNTAESLQERINKAYIFGWAHTVLLLVAAIKSSQGEIMDVSDLIGQLLINIYPIFVQLKIRNRITRVLEHREWKKNKSILSTEEEQLEKTIQEDIQMLGKITA